MTDDNMQMCIRKKYTHRKDPIKNASPKWQVVALSSTTETTGVLTEPIDSSHWSEFEAKSIAIALNKAIDQFANDNELKLADRYVSKEEATKFKNPRITKREHLNDPALREKRMEALERWLRATDLLYAETEGSVIEEINRLKCLIVKLIEENPKLQIHNESGYWSIKPILKT